MRKYSLVALLATASWCVSAHAALPPAAKHRLSKAALAQPNLRPSAQTQAAGPCGGPCLFFENFDDVTDFTAGTWIGNGLNGALGGIFETWSATCSSNNSGAPTNTEGHVETANPFSGTQHVRISKDFTAITSPFSCILDARVPASAVSVSGPISPQSTSAQLAISEGPGGANFFMQPQAPSAGFRTTTILFFYYGTRYVIDDITGVGFTFVFGGFWDTTGAYDHYSIFTDPCTKFSCNGGANEGLPCANSLDCPGSECRGKIEYSDNNGIFYTGQLWAGLTQDQILFYSDNTGGAQPLGWDIDDVGMQRDPTPCPVVCGDNDIGPGEECEPGDGTVPAQDGACPGRCVPVGGTGAQGELPCTCDIGPCATAQTIANGGPQSFTNQFGWFTFTANAPAMSVETCGTADYDSRLSIWTGTCDSLALIALNDDCYDGTGFGAGSDPLASCWSNDYTGSGYNPPFNACTCTATTEGQDYWVWDDRPAFTDTEVITLTKRLACGDASSFGACCSPFVGCVDVADAAACTALAGTSFTDSKSCAGVGAACPAPTLGACCARVDGACTETDAAGCTGNSTFSAGSRCSETTCVLATGACCDSTPFGPGCTDGVTFDQCQGTKDTWTKDTACADVTCIDNAIPTVSEWGLVIMALLLLIGAKVYFGRRSALA